MKKLKIVIPTLILLLIGFTSCLEESSDDDKQTTTPPTAAEFNTLRTTALDNTLKKQTVATNSGYTSINSDTGMKISFNANGFTLNGNAVTGDIDFTYAEIYDKGNMLVTNKATMGLNADGDKQLLISGGEFFMEVSQNGQVLDYNGSIELAVPTNLSGDADVDMSLWNVTEEEDGDIVWEEAENNEFWIGDDSIGGTTYYAYFNSFGWTNIDRFYSDPRPKTTIKVDVPEGYDNTNAAVYLAYVGETSALAQLDTYLTEEEVFSEHYGLIPIGLECHVIFVTEEDDGWRYAVKSVTIAEDDVITITYEETAVITEAQLIAAISALE